MKKYITRIYKNDSLDSIKKADREHLRILNKGYKVIKTYNFFSTCQINYQLIKN